MVLSFITNDIALAKASDEAGIDRVFIDLERIGKAERQSGKALFLSDHSVEDVRRMKAVLKRSKVMVRIDPLHVHSRQQIDLVIEYGADVLLLPFFRETQEAAQFIDLVRRRAVAALLVETPESVAVLPALCRLPGLGEVHIGLNDLSLALKKPFLFDVVADGTVDRICGTLRDAGMPFGFGGIGSLSRTDLPLNPESVLAEQVLQGATRGWLSRTFRDLSAERIPEELAKIRQSVDFWRAARPAEQKEIRGGLRRQIAMHGVMAHHGS